MTTVLLSCQCLQLQRFWFLRQCMSLKSHCMNFNSSLLRRRLTRGPGGAVDSFTRKVVLRTVTLCVAAMSMNGGALKAVPEI